MQSSAVLFRPAAACLCVSDKNVQRTCPVPSGPASAGDAGEGGHEACADGLREKEAQDRAGLETPFPWCRKNCASFLKRRPPHTVPECDAIMMPCPFGGTKGHARGTGSSRTGAERRGAARARGLLEEPPKRMQPDARRLCKNGPERQSAFLFAQKEKNVKKFVLCNIRTKL